MFHNFHIYFSYIYKIFPHIYKLLIIFYFKLKNLVGKEIKYNSVAVAFHLIKVKQRIQYKSGYKHQNKVQFYDLLL